MGEGVKSTARLRIIRGERVLTPDQAAPRIEERVSMLWWLIGGEKEAKEAVRCRSKRIVLGSTPAPTEDGSMHKSWRVIVVVRACDGWEVTNCARRSRYERVCVDLCVRDMATPRVACLLQIDAFEPSERPVACRSA